MHSINVIYHSMQDLLDLKRQIGPHPSHKILVQAICGIDDKDALMQLQQNLVCAFPDTAILGMTSNGGIIGTQLMNNHVIINVSLFNDTTVKTCFVDDDTDLEISGFQLGKQIHEQAPQVAIVFSSAFRCGGFRNDEDFIRSLNQQTGNEIVISGGLAGFREDIAKTYVFTENVFLHKGSVAALLKGKNLSASQYRNDGWAQIGRQMTITSVQGTRVYQIDHEPTKDIYNRYLGTNSFFNGSNERYPPAIEFPLVVRKNGLDMKNIPLTEHQDGSFDFLYPFETNEKVRFSFCDITMIELEAEKIKAQILEQKPESIFVYSCSNRKMIFGNEIVVDSLGLEEIASTVGFFTSTEYFTSVDMNAYCFIQNMTALTLSERSENQIPIEKTTSNSSLIQQHRSTRVLSVLLNLISATSKELEITNQKLEELANKDSLTGLYNRRFFDQKLKEEINRLHRSGTQLSLLLLDVDFFKKFNDAYGHVAGDQCLEQVGKMIKSALHRSSDIPFRYGGEEMGTIMPFTDIQGAIIIAEKIRKSIEDLAIPHIGSTASNVVTVSIGVLSCSLSAKTHIDNSDLIKACDDLLYEAKQNGRNRVVSKKISFD